LGWRLDTPQGVERDQFDRPDTVHVIARDEEHQIVGCARLLPTTGPYLLGKVFPQLMNGLPPPSTPDVWELSRFAVVDLHTWRTGISGQKPSALAVDILRRSADCVTSKGAKRLLTVSPLAMERCCARRVSTFIAPARRCWWMALPRSLAGLNWTTHFQLAGMLGKQVYLSIPTVVHSPSKDDICCKHR
jgi:N-acyl-L-homoserine lactone synthetase